LAKNGEQEKINIHKPSFIKPLYEKAYNFRMSPWPTFGKYAVGDLNQAGFLFSLTAKNQIR
jgi:hypothetical protein